MSSRPRFPLVLSVALAGALIGGGTTLATGATTPDTTPPTSTTPATTPGNPTPPVVATGGPESLTTAGATLTGSITANDAPTQWHFDYGTSSAYGLKTPETTIDPGTAAVAVKKAITGLTIGTTYHYRLVATNAAGTVRGSDKSLATTGAPKAPSVSTQTATALAPTTANLVARVNPNGQSTTYSFQYGTTTSYRSKSASASAGAGVSTATLSVPVTGLAANTRYHYRVVATNATGTSRGSDRTFTTPRSLTGVSLTAAPSTVVWNSSVVISGTVGGQGAGGVKVSLTRQSFPYDTPATQVATQTTSSAGAYSFSVGPLYSGVKLQVITQSTPVATSPVVTIGSALFTKLRISSKARRSVKLRGQIYPAVQSGRATVQRKTPRGRWIKVKRATLKKSPTADRSTYLVSVPRLARRTSYRVVVTPRDGGSHVTTTTKTVAAAKRR